VEDGAATRGGVPPTPGPVTLAFIAGNWHFTATSTFAATPSFSIAGSISQSASVLRGAVHIDGSSCFDRLAPISLTGSLTGKNISLTSASVDGQVTTFTASLTGGTTNNALTGTYMTKGGCADGDHGNVTGIEVASITSTWNGLFTNPGGDTFRMTAGVVQGNDSSEGSFGISGPVTFDTPCFSSGTITSGTFPSGSFIIGTSVALEIETGNGTLAVLGTLNPDNGYVIGGYTVSGGTCDQSGTIVMDADPWDYGPKARSGKS
jgi:hypothetical protein